MRWITVGAAGQSGTADQVASGPFAAAGPAKQNQTGCSRLVGSSQVTPAETAKAPA